ncbi:hypothetical protein IAR50_003265 [Cryptococcus sp. DSM 104548]
MPRPGQQAARRKRARVSTTPSLSTPASQPAAQQEDGGSPNPRAQCLPMADLPADFDGIPEDGAQYLAMIHKANKGLPFSTRMEGWVSEAEMQVEVVAETDGKGKERHVALPKASWEATFPVHFQGYRKNLAERWPPATRLPYPSDYPPLPLANRRSEWYMFVNGYPMDSLSSKTDKQKGKEKEKVALTEEEAMNEAVQEEEVEEEEDWRKSKGAPREPLVSLLQQLSSNQAVQILSHFGHWLTEAITQLPPPLPASPELLPTQPDGEGTKEDSPSPSRAPNPFPPHYARWILALLMLVDPYLSGNQTSTLRDLARSAMRVAGWRWVRAVVARDVGESWKLGAGGWGLLTEVGEKDEEESVDEMLARCWTVVHAVAAGWAQRDLLDDLETLFT